MAKYSTPGVYLKEIDKSEVLLTASIGGAATVVKSPQGPMWRPITLNNTRQLTGIFGRPTLPEEDEFGRPVAPDYGYGLYAASNFLAEGNGLTITRAADGDHVKVEDPANPGEFIETDYLQDYTYAYQTYGMHKDLGTLVTEAPDPTATDVNLIYEKAAQNRPNSITAILAVDETSKGMWKTDNIEKPNFGFAFAGGPSGQGYNVGTSVEFFQKGCSWMYKYDDEDKIDILVGMFEQLGAGHTTEQDIADYIDQNELVAPLVFQVKVYTKNVTDLWGTFIKDDMSAPVEVFECNATSRSLKTEQNTSLFITDVVNGNSAYVYAKYLSKLTTLEVVQQITNRVSFMAQADDGTPTLITFNGVLEHSGSTGITQYGYKSWNEVPDGNGGTEIVQTTNWFMDFDDTSKIYNAEMPFWNITTGPADATTTNPDDVINDDPRLGEGLDPADTWTPPLYGVFNTYGGDFNRGTVEHGILPGLLTDGTSPDGSDANTTKATGFTPTELTDLTVWDKYAFAIVDSEVTYTFNGVDLLIGPNAWYNFPNNSTEELVLNGAGDGWTGVDFAGDNSSITYPIGTYQEGDIVDDAGKIRYWLNKVISVGVGGEFDALAEAIAPGTGVYVQADIDNAKDILAKIEDISDKYDTATLQYNTLMTDPEKGIEVAEGTPIQAYIVNPFDDTDVKEVQLGKITEEISQLDFDKLKTFPESFNADKDVVVSIAISIEPLGVDLPAYPAILRMVDVNVESDEMFIAFHLDGGSEPDSDPDHLLDEGVQSAWMLMSDSEKYIAPHLLVPTYQTALKQFINSTLIPKRKRDCLQISQSGDVVVNQDYDTKGDLHAEKIIAAEQFGYPNSSYVGLYCGWSLVVDTANDREVWLPNAIFASQAIARTDNVANVWDAPAGQNRGVIPALRQKFDMNNDEIGKVYDNNINAAKEFMGIGAVLWGQKTAQRKASALDRINVRRTLLFIEKTVQLFLNPLILDVNNTPEIRLRVWNQINNFLQSVKAQGGLTDFQVICDDSNNTPEVIDANTLNVDILVKPVKTIEFIDVNVIVASTGLSFEEARVR